LMMVGTDCEAATVWPSLVTMDITVPLMGAVMRVYPRLAFAVSTETCAAVISASNWLMAARVVSSEAAEIAQSSIG
jgi:hypothetical protein